METKRIRCFFFALGFCKDDLDCPYKHVTRRSPKEASNATVISRSIGTQLRLRRPCSTTEILNVKGTIVKLGPGAEILGLKLSSDYSALQIRNLPFGTTTPESVQAQINQVGMLISLEDIRINNTSTSAVAHVEVRDPSFAQAFIRLVKKASSRDQDSKLDVSVCQVANHAEVIKAAQEEDLTSLPGAMKELRLARVVDADPEDLECPVCLTEATDPYPLPCGHFYCTECLQAQCSQANEFPICCLGDSSTCSSKIPLQDLRAVLHTLTYHKLIEFSLAATVQKSSLRHCPTPDCQELYRPAHTSRTFDCPQCWKSICAYCQVVAHGGDVPCLVFQGRRLAQEDVRKLEKWKANHGVKPCPKCTASIEKTEGSCNNIRCSSCETFFCWFCLEACGSSAEVYGHMTEVHGDWGLGMAAY